MKLLKSAALVLPKPRAPETSKLTVRTHIKQAPRPKAAPAWFGAGLPGQQNSCAYLGLQRKHVRVILIPVWGIKEQAPQFAGARDWECCNARHAGFKESWAARIRFRGFSMRPEALLRVGFSCSALGGNWSHPCLQQTENLKPESPPPFFNTGAKALCACSSALAWSFESLPRAGLSFRVFAPHAFATVVDHLKRFLQFLLHAVLRSRAVSNRFPPKIFCVICSDAEPRDLWGNLTICLLWPVGKVR